MASKFCFFHTYYPDTWDAMIDCGLIKEGDGVKFTQCLGLREENKFNNLAAKGGHLYNYLKKTRAPFYIDRLQGGVYIDKYPYNPDLIAEYRNLLGDEFRGWQMHEWLSNYRSDLRKLQSLSTEEWTAENIERVINEKFKMPFLFLESMTAEEMASCGKPKTIEEFRNNMYSIYRERLQRLGDLIPCDSVFLAYEFELKEGARYFMPEIGNQSADARIQICYARGMAKAYGRSFGTYYEPWGGQPFTTCCYQKDGANEWGIGDSKDFPFVTGGPNGGSSRSLQRRLFLYSYLNNASMMAEEWGLCNTFIDWKDFELSEYGKVKLDFLEFTRKYTDVGEKLTPAAVVLPEDLEVLDDIRDHYSCMTYKVDIPIRCKLERIKDSVRRVFSDPIEFAGSEYKTLINSNMPDAVDMLNAGECKEHAISSYRYLIDLTGDPEFFAKHKNCVKIDELEAILREELPCTVEGLHWMVNKRDGGGYYLTVFNNIGVTRSVADGEAFLPEATRSGKVVFKNAAVPTLLEGDGKLEADGDDYRVTIPAGGYAFISF